MARPKKAAVPVDDVADDVATSLPASVQESAIQLIPYGRLKRAPENVRKTDIAADVESLADDIAAHGLLQSLIGYAGDTDIDRSVVWIVGGGRRLQALALLHARKLIDDAFRVPVLLRPSDEAIEISLSENLARRDMNPADEFTAFAALMQSGTVSPADLAKRFGFTERYVKQRLRLAGLCDEVLDALRDGKISLEFATEYAKTTDQQLQADVFRSMQRGPVYNRDNIFSLRCALASKQLTEDDAIFRFIDRGTYEKEGGGYVEDLFADLEEGQGRPLNNGQLARDIAARCLSFQAPRVQSAATRNHPSVVGFILAPGLVLGSGKASAPSGYVEISGGWNSNLGCHVDVKECWKRADALTALIQIIVGITRETPIGDDDDGSELGYVSDYDRNRFFVPRDLAKKVLPPKHTANYGGPQLTPEEQLEKDIQREARLWAARLSGPSFKDTPFEGKVFYGEYWLRTNERRPGDPFDAPRMTAYDLRVFVTDEEIEANLAVGRERAIEERDAVEKARAEKEAAKQAAADAKAEAFAAKLAEIRALDALPEVILAAHFEYEKPSPWYLWSTGDYFDLPECDENADDAMGVEGLDELADTMATIDGFYITVADYLAAIAEAEANGDALADVEAAA